MVPVRTPESSSRDPRAEAGQNAQHRWRARPLLAFALRLLVAAVPAAAAVASTVVLDRLAPAPATWPQRIVTWSLLLGVSTIVALAVERRMRGLLPLALLLRMTLVFPDAAPSRYAVARTASSPRKIKELADREQSPRAAAATRVLALVSALAKHDRYTRGHSERVRVFTDLIAEQMGVTGPERDKLAWGALLHDIGKMTVPGKLLNKPGKPTEHEWEVLKGHPLAGAAFAGPLVEWLGPWAGGITQHHERFDGTGYPLGLAGHDIALSGRIVAVADAYETMTAARSYKKPMAATAARKELTACAGAHFDPVVVRAFLEVSLPKLMWGIGPVSFLLHLPFLTRAETVGIQLAASASSAAAPAAAAATIGAASVVAGTAVAPAVTASPPATTTPVTSSVSSSTAPGGTTSGQPGAAVPAPGGPASVSVPTSVADLCADLCAGLPAGLAAELGAELGARLEFRRRINRSRERERGVGQRRRHLQRRRQRQRQPRHLTRRRQRQRQPRHLTRRRRLERRRQRQPRHLERRRQRQRQPRHLTRRRQRQLRYLQGRRQQRQIPSRGLRLCRDDLRASIRRRHRLPSRPDQGEGQALTDHLVIRPGC